MRYFYFLVTKGYLTLVFHKGVNSIRADESSPLDPTRCLLSLVINGNVNSIRADKLSAIVSRILNKKEAFISGRFLRSSSSLIVLFDDIHFCPMFLKVKSMKTVQMFFEDCVAPS